MRAFGQNQNRDPSSVQMWLDGHSDRSALAAKDYLNSPPTDSNDPFSEEDANSSASGRLECPIVGLGLR